MQDEESGESLDGHPLGVAACADPKCCSSGYAATSTGALTRSTCVPVSVNTNALVVTFTGQLDAGATSAVVELSHSGGSGDNSNLGEYVQHKSWLHRLRAPVRPSSSITSS